MAKGLNKGLQHPKAVAARQKSAKAAAKAKTPPPKKGKK